MTDTRKIATKIVNREEIRNDDAKRNLIKNITEALSQARNEGLESALKVAHKTKFTRICQSHGHSDGEIKWTFNGCAEIEDAIRALQSKGDK